MAETSFLEADSFVNLPPLIKVNKTIVLKKLGSMNLTDGAFQLSKLEFGMLLEKIYLILQFDILAFMSDDELLVLDRSYHQIFLYHVQEKIPELG